MLCKSVLAWLKRVPGIALIVLFFFLLFPAKVHAFYIDPGTGSIIIQVLLGFLVGGLFALKIYWARVLAWSKRLFSRQGKHEEP